MTLGFPMSVSGKGPFVTHKQGMASPVFYDKVRPSAAGFFGSWSLEKTMIIENHSGTNQLSRVYAMPLLFRLGDMEIPIYPTVLLDDGGFVMVDCGYPDFIPEIEAGLEKIGLSLDGLRKIVITHHDHDHMGAAREIVNRYPAVEILCSPEQAPYVAGREKSLRLIQAERVQDSLPESEKEAGLAFQRFIAGVKAVDSVGVVDAGDILPWCGGVEVVDTKGHMPGHISLYVREEKTLIAGDALVVEDGRLCMAMPQYALDLDAARESVRRLLEYDIEKIICYHGGVYETDVADSMRAIL